MSEKSKPRRFSPEELNQAVHKEAHQFEQMIEWLEHHMPPRFFEEVDPSHMMLIAHNLMNFSLQGYFSSFQADNCAIVLSLDAPDADQKILENYNQGIKNYITFVSDEPPPFTKAKEKLRIAMIIFTEFRDRENEAKKELGTHDIEVLLADVQKRCPEISRQEFHSLLEGMNYRFVRAMNKERLAIALEMFLRAKERDQCQYEVRTNKNWMHEGVNTPSLQIVLAWRNVPKHRFLYRLAKLVTRHNMSMMRVNATYINPYQKNSVLILSLGLHGIDNRAAWECGNIEDFLKELVTLKAFQDQDLIEKVFVESRILTGNLANFVRTMVNFIHQALVHADPNLYTPANIEEGLCRHPELTVRLCALFEQKFHPEMHNIELYQKEAASLNELVSALDTGNQVNDMRRKNILMQGLNFIENTLKTNFYRNNKTGLSFRLDPAYLENVPYEWREKFPELPYGIFFIQGMYFIGFHIRFKDLARGGLRTVFPQRHEQMVAERNNVFIECYNLAYTQQKKNKDIPEGGSKAVIFLEPYDRLLTEVEIYERELTNAGIAEDEIKKLIHDFKSEQKLQYLYQSQRSFIDSFLTLINCEDDGTLKAKNIVSYYKKPEYIYLGPDENMHNEMIEWIAIYSKKVGYKPGSAFISSKPLAGINHKEFGVTSLGVNVYVEEILLHLGINPRQDRFTIKISGGPDGDVAGNEILNLYKHYPKTAKLLALIDVSGTIYDPEGLDLETMAQLFHESKSIRFYPPEKLHSGGYLLDTFTKREQSTYAQQTLCWRKNGSKLEQEWLSGNDMNHLLRHTVHKTPCDIFVPAGGRPRTLNESNWTDYLDETGKPTSRAIVEGANLYITPKARRELEKLGAIIVKDSSANKGGVICSSYEVLFGLILSDEEFIAHKKTFMPEILDLIAQKARSEAQLLIRTHLETGHYFTDISDAISDRINTFTYQILDYLETIELPKSEEDPLIECLFNAAPSFLRDNYKKRLLTQIPPVQQKAMIAAYIAAKIVYKRGLLWQPSIVDVLPIITKDPAITTKKLDHHKIEKMS